MEFFDLHGKVAIVTGGNGGLGRGMAIGLASAGADIVIAARNQAMGAGSVDDRIKAEAGLSGALSRLMVVVEQYPDLKANRNFLALQEELSSTENKLGYSRQFYNDATMQYNTKLETFPSNILAGMFHFQPSTFFEVKDEAQREAPKVKF